MRMKASINLSIDKQTGQRAKRWAQAHNTSLSSVVEAYLNELTAPGKTPFSSRWRGRFPVKTGDDPRADYLKRRYSR